MLFINNKYIGIILVMFITMNCIAANLVKSEARKQSVATATSTASTNSVSNSVTNPTYNPNNVNPTVSKTASTTTISPLKAGGGFLISNSTNPNCFYDTVGNMVTRLQVSVSRFSEVCALSTKPKVIRLLAATTIVGKIEGYKNTNFSMIPKELSDEIKTLDQFNDFKFSSYLSQIKAGVGSKADISEILKNLWLALGDDIDFIIKNNNYPFYFRGNIWNLIQSTRSLNILKTNYAGNYTECIPNNWADIISISDLSSDQNFMTVFRKNNKGKCKSDATDITIHPNSFTNGGIAITFWGSENLAELGGKQGSAFVGYINNNIVYEYNLIPQNNSILHQIKVLDKYFSISSESFCASYFFVVVSIQKDCEKYKLIFSIRFFVSNTRKTAEFEISADQVENLHLIFDKSLTFSNNVYKNFKYLPENEILLVSYSLDTGILGKLLKRSICAPNCDYSVGGTNCISCKSPMKIFDGKCLLVCPDNYYGDKDGICKPCAAPCSKCDESLNGNCKECKDPYFFYNGKCDIRCPDFTFSDTLRNCFTCGANCIECKDSKTCGKCDATSFLKDGKCVQDCGNKYFKSWTPTTCKPCPNGCETCESSDKCNTCSTGFFLLDKACVPNCGSGFWGDKDTNSCKKCNLNCEFCKDSVTCLKCFSGSSLNQGECLQKCPLKTAEVRGVCVPCTNKECEVCNADQVSECKVCSKDFYLKNFDCVNKCGDFFYADDKKNCQKCSVDCKVCSKDKCLECIPTKFVLRETQCTKECPDNYIESGKSCIKCNEPTCKKCMDTSLGSCTLCFENSNNKALLAGKCLTECPIKYFFKNNINCEPCITGCDKCQNNFNCQTCSSNYFMQNNICVTKCDSGFGVLNKTDCSPCLVKSCSICSGDKLQTCDKCNDKLNLFNNQCIEKCPLGTFQNEKMSCDPCSSDCAECENKFKCNKCNLGKVLQETACVSICNDGYIPVNGVCTKCINTNCKKCSPVDLSICTECSLEKFLHKGECKASCPDGTYPNNSRCIDCVLPCQNCTSDKKCTSCIKGFNLSGDICGDKCPDKTVAINGVCTNCLDSNCKKCNNNLSKQCISCDKDFALFEGNCQKTCPEKFFDENGVCKPLLVGCSKSKTAITCDVCVAGKYLKDGTQCVTECGDGYIENQLVCKKCVATCKKCKVEDSSSCSACYSKYFLYKSECLSICPEKTYSTEDFKCIDCPVDHCRTCNGGKTCNECSTGYVLEDNVCHTPPCSEGWVVKEKVNECAKCEVNNCKTCPNTNLKICDRCKNNYFLIGDNKCEKDCISGTFKNTITGKCQNCSSNCSTCVNDKICEVCNINFYLFDNHCVDHCELGYSKTDGKCLPCAVEGCGICSNNKICEICKSPLVLNDVKCEATCSKGSFNSSGICKKCAIFCDECKNLLNCDVCQKGKVLSADNKCIDECPSGSIVVKDRCTQCPDLKCNKCDPLNLNNCVDCLNGLVLKDNICKTDCGDYNYTENKKCFNCTDKCLKCSNKNTCTQCDKGFYLFQNSCIFPCPKGFRGQDGKCIACSEDCESCDTKTCLTCAAKTLLEEGKCVKVCSNGFYTINQIDCHPCGESCLKCFTENSCSICNAVTFIKDGKCVPNCGLGYVAANGKCVKCQNNCNVCSKENPLECTNCIVGKPLFNGICYDLCPVKHYMEDNKCFKCGDSCDKCNNNKICNTCTPPYYLNDNKICVSECPDSYNGKAGICQPCEVKECQTCKSSVNICDVCKAKSILSEGKCEPNCPISGYYKSADGIKCNKCLAPCNNCKSDSICIDCQNGYVLQNEKCVNKCNDGFVKTVGGICKQCVTKDCQICEEDLKTCQLCSTGLVLDIDSKGIFTCVTLCPVGKYNDKEKCKNCGDNCDKCSDSLQCNTCAKDFVLQNGKCQKKCDKYNVERNLQCFKCNDPKCVSCDALTLKGCNICDENYYLKNGECKPDCGNSFFKFVIGPGNNVCKACKDNCQSCVNESTCDICLPGFFLKGNDCVAKCGEGFVIKDNKSCVQCTSKYCQICDSNNVDKCITCTNGYYLKNNQCVKECGENFFQSDRGLCLPCFDNCLTCSPQNNCKVCSKNKVIVDGICKDYCPVGYVPDPKNNNVCVSCKDKNCELCNPASLDKCTQCKKGFLLGPDLTCDDKCPQKYYIVKDVSCASCAKNCDKCVSDTHCNNCSRSSNSTNSIISNFTLNQNNMCVDKCDDGSVDVNGKCTNCTSTLCSRCQATDVTQCNVCKVGLFLYGSICQTKCPDNTFVSGSTNCLDCDKKCSKCVSPTECLSCNSPYVLQDKACIEKCYDWYTNKNGTCIKCNNFEKTKSCDNNTTICRNNYFLDDNLCVDICPDGKFQDLKRNCIPCGFDCFKCASLTECKVCKTTSYLYRGACLPRCPAKTINIFGVCTDCKNTKCFECQPTDLNKCTKCDNSTLFEDDCYTACPSGTFKNGDVCQKCDIKCASCKNATTCDLCKDPFYLSNSQCIADCPIGTAKRDKNCLSCQDKNCGICNSNDLSICTSCKNGFLLGTLCVDNCPITYRADSTKKTCEKCSNYCDLCDEKGCIQCTNNFYFSESDSKFCMSCEEPSMVKVLKRCEKCKVEGCKKCEDGNSTKCKICDSKKILFNGECKDTCPERYYKSEQSCLPCVPGCLSCTNDKLCDLCEQGFEFNGLCKPLCPINTVSDPVSKKCKLCAQSLCDLCDLTNVAICKVCSKNSYLYKNSCYSICPTGTYTSDLNCIECPNGCTSCNKNGCVGCTDKKVLKGTQCVDSCGEGYFQSAVKCEKCTDNNCKTCSPANTCLQCNENSFLMENEHNCVITCSNGYFADKISRLCVKCDEGCSICTGSKSCLTCEKGLNMFKGNCIKVCPDGFSPVSNVCQPCQIGCSKCPSNSLICEECTSPNVLYNKNCITSCPTATFVSDSKCIDCDKKCNKCKDEFQCEECKPEFNLRDGKCLEKCSDGKVEVNGRCMPCGDSNCKSCLSDTNICVECLNSFYLYDNSCRTKCPNGTFVDKGIECKNCLEGCDQCTDAKICNKCTHNYFLYDKKCVKECPIGMYGNCVENVCYNCLDACQDCADGTAINCPKCAKGFFKNENVCVLPINCRKGTYANDESRTCLTCKIPYCAECIDRTTCKVCVKGFELNYGACIQSKTFLPVLSQSPNLFSSNTLRLYKFNERKSFNLDLKGTGIGTDNFNFNFWLRRITDIPATTKIFETESLGIAMKLTFEIELKDANEECRLVLNQDTNMNVINLGKCSSKELRDWKFFSITLYKSSEKATVDIMMKDSLANETKKNLGFPISKTVDFINKDSFLVFNNNVNKDGIVYSSAFELANFNVLDYDITPEDIKSFSLIKPFNCDYTCADCKGVCLKCQGDKLPSLDGYCSASFVALMSDYQKIASYTSIELRSKVKKKLDSDRYGLFLWFNSNNTINNNFDIAYVYYAYKSAETLIKLSIEKNKFVVYIGEKSFIAFDNRNIDRNHWYYVGAMIKDKSLQIFLKDQSIITESKIFALDSTPIRITKDALFTNGPSILDTNRDFFIGAYYDIRLYTNNVPTEDQIKEQFSRLPCPKSCVECASDLTCAKCADGFTLTDGVCADSKLNRSVLLLPKDSFFNNDILTLSIPTTFAFNKYTVNFFWRKKIHSPASPNYNILSFEGADGKTYPLIQESCGNNYNSTFTILGQSGIPATFIHNFTNEIYNYFVFVIQVDIPSKTLSYNIFDGQEHLAVQVISQEIKKFIIGDVNGKEMNFEIGNFKLYQVLVGKDEIIKLRTKAPLDCDPGCSSCDYQTGLCDSCLTESGKAVKVCSNVLRGYSTSSAYNIQTIDPNIAQQYSVTLSSIFKKDINSEEYSIIGYFRLFDVKIFSEYKNDKFQILRVSNRNDNVTSPSSNLITLEISTLNGIAQYYFVYNDGDQIVRSLIKDLDVIDNSWLLIYATVNVIEKTLKYAIKPINSAKIYLDTLKYVNYPEKLSELGTLTIFGIGIGLPKEYHIVNGNFYKIYLGVNLKWNMEIFEKFRISIPILADPICPENCDKCFTNDQNIIECLKCKAGFELENQKCFQSDSKYIILADQNTFAFLPPLTDVILPASLSLFTQNTITFYVRRNYVPKVLNKENTIFKSGNVSIKMNSNLKGDASLSIGVDNNPTSLTFNIDQNLEVDYDWYLVIINYSPSVLDIILKTETTEEKKGLILPENNKVVISTISFNSLIDELSIYAPNIIQRSFYNINFSKPSTFCELDCVVCMDNKCRQCYYGFDSNGICNKIPIKIPSFSVVSGSKFANSFSLTDYLTSSQPLRSSSWSLLFTFELNNDFSSYGQNGLATLFRLTNNKSTSNDNTINDNLFSVMFNKNNSFFITFSNRYYYAQLRSPNGITTSSFKYDPTNKNYFIGIIFDAQKNEILLQIYNSDESFIKETYSFKGKSENLNTRSNLIFAESFQNSANMIIIEHVQFFYDTAVLESKFDEYKAKHFINYQNTCLSNSRISCKICSLKDNFLIEGVCSPVSNIYSWLLNKIKSVSTLSPGLTSDKKMYFAANESQFTVSFWYRRLNYSIDPHGILKLNLNDGIKVTQFINFRLMGGDLYVDLFNQNSTQVNGLKLSTLYSAANGLTWHYLSVSVDVNSNTIQLFDFDFKEKKNRLITSNQSKIATGIVLNSSKYMTLLAGFDTTVSKAGYNFQLSSFIYSSNWFPKDTSSYESYRVRIPRKCDMNCKTECDALNLCPVLNQFNGAILVGDIINSPLLKGKTDIASVNSLKLFRFVADMVSTDIQGQPVWDHYLVSFEIDVNLLLTSAYKSNKNILIDINNSPFPRNTELTMNDIVPDDLVKFGAFAVEVTSDAIRFYLGSSISNKVINYYDFKTDNLKGISKITMQVYIDSNNNLGRITAYIDDLRSFYDLKITFSPEPISLSTLVYNHPAVLNMRINVSNPRFIADYYQYIYGKIQEISTYPSKICGDKCLKCTYIPNSTSLNCDKCLNGYFLVNGGCLKNNLTSK